MGLDLMMTALMIKKSNEVMTGKLFINSREVYAMLDIGSIHSFISPICTQRLNLPIENLNLVLSVEISLGEIPITFTIYKSCLV